MTTTPTERQQWTAVGADRAAQDTYTSIKRALAEVESRRGLSIFLQGSYANHTNIRADSDVDIVAMTRYAFRGSVERLSDTGLRAYQNLPSSSFTPIDLRTDIYQALVKYYGSSRVEMRKKCIRVAKTEGYVDADVVPCDEYHYYTLGASTLDDYVEGICITPPSGDRIINFPKEHISNGQVKNYLADMNYKPTVRQIKRLRNKAVDLGLITHDEAPGYLLECMTFNVPNSKFIADDAQRLWDVVLHLHVADKATYKSCDEIHTLFGTDPGRFSLATADRICKALWDAL